MESLTNVFECKSNLQFSLSNKVNVKCDKWFDFNLNYDELAYFQFINYNNPVLITKRIDFKINLNLLEVTLDTISFYEDTSIIFSNFINISLLEPHIERFKSDNTELLYTIDWPEIMISDICPWIDGKYREKYKYLSFYYDEIEKTSTWRKICMNNKGYLYYLENQIKGKMVITTAIFYGVIALAIVLILLLILSLYCIALKVHFQEINDLSSNENDFSDIKSDENNASSNTQNDEKEQSNNQNEEENTFEALNNENNESNTPEFT